MSDLLPSSRPLVLVTGATGGIGSAIVRDLSTDFTVVAIGRNAAALDALATQTGCRTERADITDGARMAEIIASCPSIDALVLAAAVGTPVSLDDTNEKEWLRQLHVNLVSPAETTRLALPALRRSAGTVVFIGSGASTHAMPGSVLYTASKHALKGVADVLRIDEENSGVRVVTVAPGPTDTAMQRELVSAAGARYQRERYIRPESVASAVRFAIEAPADAQITDITVRPRREIKRS